MLPHHKSVLSRYLQVTLLSVLLLLYSGASEHLSVAATMTTNPKSVLLNSKTVTTIKTIPTDFHLSSWGPVDTRKIVRTNMHNVYLRRHPTSITSNKRTHHRLLYDTTDFVADYHHDQRMIQANRDDPPFPPAIGILIPIVLILVIVLVSCACCKCCYFYPYLCCVSHEDKEEILEGRKKKAMPS